MAGDGLFDPLGLGRAAPTRASPFRSPPILVATLAALAAVALAATAWWRDDGDRGRPRAIGPIERVVVSPKPVIPPPVQAPTPAAAVPPGFPTGADQDVEIQNGVRIIRPRREPAPPSSAQTVTVPPAPPAR